MFFAQHFYWSLAHGLGVGEASREARIAVNYSMTGEAIDWAIPVVYSRDPNSRLCPDRPRDLRTFPSPSVQPSVRRSVAQHTARVAVWDTHSQFPELRKTLDQMNAAQTYYGFEIVDLSVPIDAWLMEDDKRYLYADLFADRLAPQISQLGVNYISAIVDSPMAYDEGKNKRDFEAYGWWSDGDQPPVLIFSTDKLGLETKGPATDRAIANVIVAGLAGYLLDTGSHSTSPQDCPNYYNPKRRLDIVTGRQKFCKVCLPKLSKFPEEIKALNALLAVFSSNRE